MGFVTLDSVVRAGDLFNSLEREEEREPERKFEVKANPRLEELIEIFGKVKKDFPMEIYDEYVKLTPNVYSASEIGQLSLMLTEKNIDYFRYKYGLLLSSLINQSSDSVITIYTYNIETPPLFIGYKNNGKIINVNGNTGSFLGEEMSGGELIVNGNVRDYLAYQMKEGKIILNGDAESWVSEYMGGGEIHLNGDYKSLSKCIWGGNIYHQGVQLIKNGKAVPGVKIKWE